MLEFNQLRARLKRAWKEASVAGRNLPLTLTSFGVLTCVELFTAGGIVQTTTETVAIFGYNVSLAMLEVGLSYGCGILSILGSSSVAELRSDPRPDQRRRAGAARLVSTLLMVVPIVFFTNALALQNQRAARAEYVASEAYGVHQQMVRDMSLDSTVRLEAAANLERAAEVKTVRIDDSWFGALFAAIFVYGTLGWSNTALHRPRPETAWEAKERARDRKRRMERERRELRHKERQAEERALQKGGAKVFDLLSHLRAG